ncbi:hypothetical protein ACFL4Q_03590 [candidate division KSB1 bacterium]
MEVTALGAPKALISYNETAVSFQSKQDSSENFSSISVTYSKYALSAESATYSIAETRPGGKDGERIEKPSQSDAARVAQLKNIIHEQVLAAVKESLGLFYKENPEAIEQVSRGEIPEYFNVENTAQRILSIYFNHYTEGQDRVEFAERAKGIINQAYGEVEGLVGELPDIVLETRKKVMEILNKFAAGEDISDFMQIVQN